MDQADAFRYAQLSQDEDFQNRAMALQEEGMSLDESYRRAELDQQNAQFAKSFGLSEQQFAEQTRQFEAQHLEDIASRLQQAGQFSESLAAEIEEGRLGRKLEEDLRSRAMDLLGKYGPGL